jgi:hypothetical protein
LSSIHSDPPAPKLAVFAASEGGQKSPKNILSGKNSACSAFSAVSRASLPSEPA